MARLQKRKRRRADDRPPDRDPSNKAASSGMPRPLRTQNQTGRADDPRRYQASPSRWQNQEQTSCKRPKRAARSTDLPTSPLNSTTACPRSGSRVAPCENSTAGTRTSLHPSPFDVQSSLHLQSLVSFQISASFEAYVWRPRRSRLRAAGGHGQPRRRPSPPKANALPHTIRISNNISSTTTSILRSTTSPMTVDPVAQMRFPSCSQIA